MRLIAAHPAVEVILAADIHQETGVATIEIALKLGLPNAWMADGVSPNRVRSIEPITLVVPAAFPLKPPHIYLREDFDRGLAHVMPGPPNERPVPCIYDGSLAELLQEEGLAGILNQLVVWLENAALGRLIDRQQGWESVRRDSLDDFLIADAAYLRSLVKREEGHAIFQFDYLRYEIGSNQVYFHGEVDRTPLTLHPKTISSLFWERPLLPKTYFGRAVAIFVWPGRQPSGKPIVANRYEPETVVNLGGLMERANGYGCAAPLQAAFGWLKRCLSDKKATRPCPLAVILCARRPFHLIGSESALELCPYLIEIDTPRLFPEGDQTRVRPTGHRHSISSQLLRSMSGENLIDQKPPHWIQIGAGSLGSKIALYLARAGRAPQAVIDRYSLNPHNAARHGLTPIPGSMQITWMGSKAVALAEAIKGLGQTAEAFDEDVIGITRDADRAKRMLPKKSWAVVNSTASLAVREAFASVPEKITIPRVIETSLFADGRVGLLSVEGPQRNPTTGDLITETYTLMREDPTLRDLVFSGREALRRQAVGEGCSSVTMVMSDAQISMLAAPMAEALMTLQKSGLPQGGRILLGVVANDGMSQSWRDYELPPWIKVAVNGASAYRVRIAERAHSKIIDEVARWPALETGGVLVGRFSEVGQTFYIVDVLPAPEDSRRSAAEFVLGTVGVRSALRNYSESCQYSLYCLGTWHSHLNVPDPSARDRATAATVALARLMPSVLLIHTPMGYRAVLADSPASTKPASVLAATRRTALTLPP